MPRSLRVRQDCIPRLKASLLRNGFPSQKLLAETLLIAQSTVSHFLNGKPVDYINFVELCHHLGHEWREIADLDAPTEASSNAYTVVISANSDSLLAACLQNTLSQTGHQVSRVPNPLQLRELLQKSDYWLLLLSQTAVTSEILLEVVQLALELHQTTPQKPALFPIYLENAIPSFDLNQYLQGIPAWRWRNSQETPTLVSDLVDLMTQGRTALLTDHPLAVTSQPPILEDTPLPVAAPELPEGQVEVASRFYIERPPIETRCYQTIIQPGALIRIKAPRQMGKTSLLARILHHAEQQGSTVVALSLQLANKRVLHNSDTFLQWFCASIGQSLGLLEPFLQCWELADIIGASQCCKAYFEQYILAKCNSTLTLGLDEVDRVFESPEIADDFFGLLRALHEEAKRRDIWKKFRLVVVHSTEVYIPLDVNKSPFNIGLPIELPEFNLAQVQALALRHGLSWTEEETTHLMALVGGHPYLVRLALYHLAHGDLSLSQLVTEAATESGIYSDHLRRHLWNLEKYPDLLEAMQAVVSASGMVKLRSQLAFKLNSMGLVKLEGNACQPRCQVYRDYFCDRLC